jgi:hypothetical protein
LEEDGGTFERCVFDTLLERLMLFDLLVKKTWNVPLMQDVREHVASVHSVDHEYRYRKRISSDLHILDLLAFDVEETIAEDHGSPILEFTQ